MCVGEKKKKRERKLFVAASPVKQDQVTSIVQHIQWLEACGGVELFNHMVVNNKWLYSWSA